MRSRPRATTARCAKHAESLERAEQILDGDPTITIRQAR